MTESVLCYILIFVSFVCLLIAPHLWKDEYLVLTLFLVIIGTFMSLISIDVSNCPLGLKVFLYILIILIGKYYWEITDLLEENVRIVIGCTGVMLISMGSLYVLFVSLLGVSKVD